MIFTGFPVCNKSFRLGISHLKKPSRAMVKAVAGVSFLALILFGCTMQYAPTNSSIDPGRIPGFKAAAPVKLLNTQQSSEEVVTSLGPNKLSVNYKKYTDSALELIRKELVNKGGVISNDGSKAIKLAITDIKMAPPTFTCIINYTVETGDGYLRGFEVSGANWNFHVALDTAVANVAISVLNNETILNYLEK